MCLQSSQATANISVIDINDNTPSIISKNLSFQVPREKGALVTTLQVSHSIALQTSSCQMKGRLQGLGAKSGNCVTSVAVSHVTSVAVTSVAMSHRLLCHVGCCAVYTNSKGSLRLMSGHFTIELPQGLSPIYQQTTDSKEIRNYFVTFLLLPFVILFIELGNVFT